MTKSEKVTFVINTLNELYPEIPIPLDHKDPYTLLIAVLLSAQCTDERVNIVTKELFKKYNKPQDFINLTQEGLENEIFSTGFSSVISLLSPCPFSNTLMASVTFKKFGT